MTPYIVFLILFTLAFISGRMSAWRTCERLLARRDALHKERLHAATLRAKREGVAAERFLSATKSRAFIRN